MSIRYARDKNSKYGGDVEVMERHRKRRKQAEGWKKEGRMTRDMTISELDSVEDAAQRRRRNPKGLKR